MPVFTVQTLIDRAAAISDMHDQFVAPASWVAWYNLERQALQIFMAMHGWTMHNLTTTTVIAPDVVTIANDILALVGVWENRSGRFRQLKVLDYPGNNFQGAGGPQTGPANFVTLEQIDSTIASSNVLRFFPRDTSGTYVIVTMAVPAVVVGPNETTSLPMGIEERIVLGMARRALVKEESDTAAVEKLIREQDQLIEAFVSKRAMAQGMSVRNVDAVERASGWSVDMLYPEVSRWTWI